MNFSAWIEGGKDSIYEGQSLQLNSDYFGTSYNYSWTPSQGLSNPYIYNPTAEPKTTTTYYVTVSDQYGCTWMGSITIYVSDVICDEPYIFVPNSFSPNGDGVNDKIYVRSSVIYEVDFRIYNRWGELVFQTNDLTNGWDGYYKGNLSEPGVFVYYLDVICYNKEIFKKKGNITLIR
jgi:gliding motility-associated-like protein